MSKRTELEDALAIQLDYEGIPYKRQFKALSDRELSWDFNIDYDPFLRPLLVEVQGGIWHKGGHSSGTGITRDCEKLCLATIAGAAQMNVTGQQIKDGDAIDWILQYLRRESRG